MVLHYYTPYSSKLRLLLERASFRMRNSWRKRRQNILAVKLMESVAFTTPPDSSVHCFIDVFCSEILTCTLLRCGYFVLAPSEAGAKTWLALLQSNLPTRSLAPFDQERQRPGWRRAYPNTLDSPALRASS
jgi:hypothetical protein